MLFILQIMFLALQGNLMAARTILLAPYRSISKELLKSIRDENYLVGRKLQNRSQIVQN